MNELFKRISTTMPVKTSRYFKVDRNWRKVVYGRTEYKTTKNNYLRNKKR